MIHPEIKNLNAQSSFSKGGRKIFILVNFFLIIIAYHILRDLKDTLIVTSCDTGAKIIPFIKIWAMVPFALLGSYVFQKLYTKFGRDRTFYILVGSLALFYLFFAFYLFPNRETIHLDGLATSLERALPASFSGWTNMIRYWSFSLFYSLAEMWSVLVISVLFWSSLNEITPSTLAKRFFPTCIMIGNFAGIVSGQISYFIIHYLCKNKSFDHSVQILILVVVAIAALLVFVHHRIYHDLPQIVTKKEKKLSFSFSESLQNIWRKPELLCIAALVIGFALTNNLFEVVWKNSIKSVHATPAAYNAYINQITTIIGVISLILSFFMRYIFRYFKQSSILLMTPAALLITSSLFFLFLQAPSFAKLFHMPYAYFVMTFGSLHYILSLGAKYSLFDSSKEIAFLAIEPEERIKAKSIIDSVGSRIGKSGSSLLHQFLLILFTGAYIPSIAILSISFMTAIFLSAKKLGKITNTRPLAT